MITIKNNKDLEKFIKWKDEWNRLEIIIEDNQDVVISAEEEMNILPVRVFGNLRITDSSANIADPSRYIRFYIEDKGQCDISLSRMSKDCQILIYGTDTGVVRVHGEKDRSWIHEHDICCKVDYNAKLFWGTAGNLKASILQNEYSTAHIITKGQANLDVLCFDRSTAFVSATDHSKIILIARDDSACDISLRGHSSSYIRSYNNSKLKIDVYGNSSATIEGRE